MTRIFDASGCIAGRLASKISKLLLSGESVIVVNAENSVISGNPDSVARFYKQKTDRGDRYHGPFYPKKPERIFIRIVRGMIPKKKQRILKKLKVFLGAKVPTEISVMEGEIVNINNSFKAEKLSSKFITLGELSKRLGK